MRLHGFEALGRWQYLVHQPAAWDLQWNEPMNASNGFKSVSMSGIKLSMNCDEWTTLTSTIPVSISMQLGTQITHKLKIVFATSHLYHLALAASKRLPSALGHMETWTHGYSRRILEALTLHHLATSDEPPAPKAPKTPKKGSPWKQWELVTWDCRTIKSPLIWLLPGDSSKASWNVRTSGEVVKWSLVHNKRLDMSHVVHPGLGVRAASL